MPLSVVPLCKKMNKATCMCARMLLQGTDSSGCNQGGQLGGEKQEENTFPLYTFYVFITFNSVAAQITKKVIVKDGKPEDVSGARYLCWMRKWRFC